MLFFSFLNLFFPGLFHGFCKIEQHIFLAKTVFGKLQFVQ